MTYPTPTNMTGMFSLAVYANTVTNGWFWSLILFALFFTIFFALKGFPAPRAFATATFIVWLVSLMMFVMTLISLSIFVLCTILMGLGIAGLIVTNRG